MLQNDNDQVENSTEKPSNFGVYVIVFLFIAAFIGIIVFELMHR